MRKSLDGKSLLAGAFAGAVLVAGLGAMQKAGPETGRFQIAAAGTGQSPDAQAFVLDTATGEVWASENEGFTAPKLDADR